MVKVAILALAFLVINGCLLIVRDQISRDSIAFVTFLNVFPVQTGSRAIVAVLVLYFAIHVLISLRNSDQFREQNAQPSVGNTSAVTTLVTSLACVQVVKLALPISNMIFTSLMIRKHFNCRHYRVKTTYECSDDLATALSLGEYFSTGNIFILEYAFIVIRVIRDSRVKPN